MKRSGIGKRADVFRLFLRLGEVLLEFHVLGFVGKLLRFSMSAPMFCMSVPSAVLSNCTISAKQMKSK